MSEYKNKTLKFGIAWTVAALIVIVGAPIFVCIIYQTSIDWMLLGAGLIAVVPIYWPVGLVEVLTYTPMLGIGGTFLSFVSGNITNIKVPAVINSVETNNIKNGTEEYEAVATISVAVCSIATTLIIAICCLGLSSITPVLNNPALNPVFDNILPAVFGGLGYMYLKKNWKVAIVPIALMAVLFICIPPLSSMVGIMVPVGILVSVSVARLLYKKKLL